ncbi:MAG TPA: hypothetical protein VIL48_04485 [Acidimicrobiales bacterium]
MLSLTARATHDLFPLPDHEGRALSINAAVELCGDRLRGLPPAADEAPTTAPAPAAEAVFRRVGEFWEVRYAGRSAHLAGTKGMDDLARLLAEPEREIHCLDLMGAGVQSAATGEAIDETARRRYERRIRELQAEIDEAEADHDDARAARARAELDALVDHLTAALGLGGRARRTGSDAERARSAVTQRLRAAIRRIASAHPPLGRHLESSIRSGTWCAYRPERPTTWLT